MPSAPHHLAAKRSLLGPPGGELVLRVLGPQHHGRQLRLHAPKCTIGSGANCTLRLRARGIRPVHCLILRGSAGTFIRRWSPGTYLNDAAFTESLLRQGDRIHIGPVELEVVQTASIGADAGPANESEHTRDESPELTEQLHENVKQLQAMLAQTQSQLQQTSDSHQRDLDESATWKRTAEQRSAELTAVAQRHAEQVASWETERLALQQQVKTLTEKNHKIELEGAQLISDAERAAESLREESQRLLQQLEAANETILEKARRISELELSVHVKLQEHAAPTPREPLAVPIAPAPADSQLTAPVAEQERNAPEGINLVDAQTPRGTMVLGPDFHAQQPPAGPSECGPNDPSATAPGANGTNYASAPEEHDGDIQSYMQRLLERVGGGVHAGHEVAARLASPVAAQPPAKSAPPPAQGGAVESAAIVSEPGTPPRRQAPESVGDVAILRELANCSAHIGHPRRSAPLQYRRIA